MARTTRGSTPRSRSRATGYTSDGYSRSANTALSPGRQSTACTAWFRPSDEWARKATRAAGTPSRAATRAFARP